MNTSKLGIIQILSLGFESVVRALWVLVIPMVLDLFFWLGPHLSIRTLFDRLLVESARTSQSIPGLQPMLAAERETLAAVGDSLNLFGLLATDFMGLRVLPVPSLKGFELASSTVASGAVTNVPDPRVLPIDNLVVAFFVSLVLLAIGLFIGALYLTLVADRVRLGGPPARPLPLRVFLVWLRLMAFVALVVAIYVLFGLPFSIVVLLAGAINAGLAGVVLVGGWLFSFWLLLYLWFAAYAMVIDGVGILRAMWYSANIVQRNLLSTFALILLSNLIGAGMLVLWQLFEGSWYGDLLAIAGNAFVGSGLVAAAFVFYQDRLRAWQDSTAQSKLMAARRA